MNLKERKKEYIGCLEGRKGRGKWCNYIIFSRNKTNFLHHWRVGRAGSGRGGGREGGETRVGI